LRLIASGPADYQELSGAVKWREFAVPEGGLEPPEILDMLAGWSARLLSAQGWGTWLAVQDGEVVASLAVKDKPDAGVIEIGYAVAPARRGRGIATKAVRALVELLVARGVTEVLAETGPGNAASAQVLHKVGFGRVGQRLDPEEGLVDLWALVPSLADGSRRAGSAEGQGR
jgi:RimJ/RimL family protein N-acetyltransferase